MTMREGIRENAHTGNKWCVCVVHKICVICIFMHAYRKYCVLIGVGNITHVSKRYNPI